MRWGEGIMKVDRQKDEEEKKFEIIAQMSSEGGRTFLLLRLSVVVVFRMSSRLRFLLLVDLSVTSVSVDEDSSISGDVLDPLQSIRSLSVRGCSASVISRIETCFVFGKDLPCT